MTRRVVTLIVLLLVTFCSGRRMSHRIVLVPIGPVPGSALAHIQKNLHGILHREVTIAVPIARPATAFDRSRQQYLGSALLAELKRHDDPAAERVIGIIDADTYAPGLNFIFGQAMKPGRFAIVALPRMRDSFRGRPEDESRFLSRAVKETVHEIGHTFGFEHCPNSKCVMYFSNSFRDTDNKTAAYCDRERLPD